MKILKLILVGSFFVVSNGNAAKAPPSTSEVWQHHIEAWSQRDLAQIASDYDQDSLLILNGKVFQGEAQIKIVFQKLFQIFDGGENQIDPVIIKDRIVFITWHFKPRGHQVQYGTDTFVIENGKIKVQMIASPLYDLFPIAGD
jgi:hypothetical protein